MIQFTWRLLEFSAFFLSVVSAINLGTIIKGINKFDVIVITIIAMLSLVPLYPNYIEKDDNIDIYGYNKPVSVDENTGRVHAGCASFEYLPSKAFKNLDYIKKRSNSAEIISGNAQISNEVKESTNMTFYIQTYGDNTKIELPYIYYIGYNAMLIDKDNNRTSLKTYESDKGFIQIEIPENSTGKVYISYTGTNLMKISYITAICGIILYIRKNKINC